ncbi:MAG: ABC transporter ATP-binding protein, partial [Mycoplasmatales bacterium]
MISYKRAWYFVKHYKFQMILMIILMILVQFLNMLSPLIMRQIIDENLVGITHPWVTLQNSDDKTVEYNSMYFKQEKNIVSNNIVLEHYSIVMENDKYYMVNAIVTPKTTKKIVGDEMIIDGISYPAIAMSPKEVELFYGPAIPVLFKFILLLLIVSIISIIFGYAQRLIGAFITIGVTKDVRVEAMKRIQYLPLDMVESEPAGKTANRILNDSMGISSLYTTSLNIFFSTFVSIVFCYIGMWILDPGLATVCIIIVPIMIIWIKWFTQKINIVATNVQETNSKMIGSVNEIINGIGILKIFNRDKETIDDFADLNDQYVNEAMSEVNLHITKGWNGINLFQGIIGALIIIFFSMQNIKGNIFVEAGVIFAYYSYVTRLITPIGALFHAFGELENSKVKIIRIFKIFDAKLEEKEITVIKPFNGDIKFEDLTYSYNQGHVVLDDINLNVKSGEKIGLVGHTGSGKSTMMNLLLRFNDIKEYDKGNIYVDGVNINSMTKRTYRQHIGIILQEPILFSGTIYDNIKFGQEVSKDQAKEMLIKVGGQKLLDKLENGIDEVLSRKGNNLSLGEKQLISFARILVSNPSIIIMDEATANIDTETEDMISRALEVITKGRTTIIIAHRLSTIIDSNQIIVLNKGKIIESGRHNELLAINGYYADMYRS